MIIVWFLWSFFLRVSVFAYALKKKKKLRVNTKLSSQFV